MTSLSLRRIRHQCLLAICLVPLCIAGCPDPDQVIGDAGGATSDEGVVDSSGEGGRSYEYDAAGRLIKVTYDGGGSVAATYDKSGNALTITGTPGTGAGAPPGPGGGCPLVAMAAFTLLSIWYVRLHPARRHRRRPRRGGQTGSMRDDDPPLAFRRR